MKDDIISEALDLEVYDKKQLSKQEQSKSVTIVNQSSESEDIENDFKYSRGNLYQVIENGTHALEELLDVARDSQHPRAYEVVSTLMKTLIDANKDLLELSKKKEEIKKITNGGKDNIESPQTVNQSIFVGSTNELQELLKDMKNNDKQT